METTLENVKAGDELVVTGFGIQDHIVKTDRVTERFIVAAGQKYSKENGCQYPREKWGNKYIVPLTDERRTAIIARAQAEYLAEMRWSRLDPGTLNELAQFMHSHGFDTMPIKKSEVAPQ